MMMSISSTTKGVFGLSLKYFTAKDGWLAGTIPQQYTAMKERRWHCIHALG